MFVAAGTEVFCAVGHTRSVRGVAFAPDQSPGRPLLSDRDVRMIFGHFWGNFYDYLSTMIVEHRGMVTVQAPLPKTLAPHAELPTPYL